MYGQILPPQKYIEQRRPILVIQPILCYHKSLLQNKTLAYDFGGDLYIQSSEHFKCCADNISIIFLVL